MMKTVVGCGIVICCGLLLLPWLVDTTAPVVASELRVAHHLAVADLTDGSLGGGSDVNVSPR